jgi:hypothetical protein
MRFSFRRSFSRSWGPFHALYSHSAVFRVASMLVGCRGPCVGGAGCRPLPRQRLGGGFRISAHISLTALVMLLVTGLSDVSFAYASANTLLGNTLYR